MKLECSLEKLKNAVVQVERITGKNLTLPILSSILLEATGNSIKLRSTNLSLGIEIEVPAKIEKEGIAAIKGDVLMNLLTTLPSNQNAFLEIKDDNLVLSTKGTKTLLKNYPNDDFPSIPIVAGETFSIPAKKLIDGIKSVYYSASVSDMKPEVSSVYIYPEDESLVFVATDSFRLAEKKIKIKTMLDFSGILIPYKNILEIVRIFGDSEKDISVCFSKNQISFSSDGIYLTSRLIDGVFPDYKQIIPKGSTTEVTVLKQDLLNALKISNIFSDKFNQITLSVSVKDKTAEFFAKNADVGEASTTVSAALSGEDVDVSFNYKYFLDSFQSLLTDSVTLHINGSGRAMVIKGVGEHSFLYLLMPMNR